MDRYKEIREIILNITRSEINVVKGHIECYKTSKSSTYRASIDLINSIIDFPEKSEKEILKIIGLSTSSTSNSIFYRNTRNLINEALSLDINIHRQFEYSNGFRNKTASRKKLILAEMFLNKGLAENAQLLLEEIISKSTKYEEFNQVIEAYELLKLDSIVHTNLKEFERIDQELKIATEKRDSIQTAKKVYQNMLLNESLPLPKSRTAAINNGLNVIQEKSKYANCDKVIYYKNMIEAEKQILKGSYKDACKILESVLIDASNKAPLQSSQREAQILLKIATCYVKDKDYKRAKPIYEKAASIYKKSDFEYYAITNKMLFLDFYLGNKKEIKKLIALRVKSKYISAFKYAVAQYELFNASLLYLNSKSDKVAKLLLSSVVPSNEVSYETQLGLNYLLLISGVDNLTSQKTLAEQSIEVAFKNIEIIKAKHTLSKRDKLIIRILKKLNGRNFDFELAKSAIAENIKDLISNSDNAWKPFSHEIIRLDNWIQSKTKNQKAQ